MKHPLQFILNTEKKRPRKKTHEQIARDLAEFEARGGKIEVCEGPELQPGRRVWTYGERIGMGQ